MLDLDHTASAPSRGFVARTLTLSSTTQPLRFMGLANNKRRESSAKTVPVHFSGFCLWVAQAATPAAAAASSSRLVTRASCPGPHCLCACDASCEAGSVDSCRVDVASGLTTRGFGLSEEVSSNPPASNPEIQLCTDTGDGADATTASALDPKAVHTCPRFSFPQWPHLFLDCPCSVSHRPR